MIGKLLPLILVIMGVGGGVGAGLALKPAAAPMPETEPAGGVAPEMAGLKAPCGEQSSAANFSAGSGDHAERSGEAEQEKEYVRINNQFLVPVVAEELIQSLVVMSLSLEVAAGQSESVYALEPRLRDAFLQVLFDHANIGGFRGEFTNAKNLQTLRTALTDVARSIVGNVVKGVLITDIARQDV